MDTTRKYDISQQQFRKIRPNFIDCMDNVSGFLDEALANKLLTPAHKNEVLSNRNPDDQARQLHDYLTKKLPYHSDKVVSALRASQHYQILSLLDNTDLYPMKNIPHGRVLILNNKTFDKLLLPRIGSDRDVEKIEQLFKKLNFDVKVYCDRKTSEMEKIIEEECNADAENEDCFVLFLMSHGKLGNIYGTDSEVLSYSRINQLLCASKLKGKPKVIYINSCQGDLKEEKVVPYFEADHLFIHFATVSGQYGRRIEEGSFFIQSLISVYEENQGNCNVNTLASTVNAKVQELIKKTGSTIVQTPISHSTLKKELIFRSSN